MSVRCIQDRMHPCVSAFFCTYNKTAQSCVNLYIYVSLVYVRISTCIRVYTRVYCANRRVHLLCLCHHVYKQVFLNRTCACVASTYCSNVRKCLHLDSVEIGEHTLTHSDSVEIGEHTNAF
jgi:hypothetical protein